MAFSISVVPGSAPPCGADSFGAVLRTIGSQRPGAITHVLNRGGLGVRRSADTLRYCFYPDRDILFT